MPPKFEIFLDRLEITSAGGLISGLNREEFFEGYSIPRNKEIMRIFKDLDMVEYLGSGIPRILKAYSKNCFKFTDNFLRMSFPKAVLQNDEHGGAIENRSGAIGGAIVLTPRQKQIIERIRQNDTISYRIIAGNLNINESAVLKHFKSLKEKGVIERIGGTRGHWQINIPKGNQ